MNELQIFNYNGNEVRTIQKDGEPWWVLKDVCSILELTDTNKTAERLDTDELTRIKFVTGGQNREMLCINESGLYNVILRSDKPEAKPFRKWVTSEVLPSIRKHGAYMTPQKIEEVLLNPDTIIRLATDLKAEQEKRALLEAKVEQDKPKVIFADAVSASNSSMLVRDVAKMIRQNGVSMGEKRFYKWLREHGYICKGSTSPTQKAMELGLFETVIRTVERGDGLPIETKTTKITGKGQQYFINKFLQ